MNFPINQTGKKIQNYVYNYCDFLGAGNFSKCYKGLNQVTISDQVVAIKIVELNSLKSQKLEQLLFQQIQILKKLNHPSVLKCYQIFTSNRNCYIITEICNEGNLQIKLKLKGLFDENQANPIIRDVYDGLVYLAQNNIVHRDLKSANIFLHNGRAKIADFGFAKQISHNFKDLNIGSPLYMAPQGILHNVYGPKTEVWALGILVYELFHGASPYIYCKTEQDLRRNVMIPLNWNQLRPNLSQDLKQFILTCLQINEQRRATIQQLNNCGYVRRLHQNSANYSINRFQLLSPSKSVHSTNRPENQANRESLERANSNFRVQNMFFRGQHNGVRNQNHLINRQASNNKIQRQVVFRSVDAKNIITNQYKSPKRPSILGQANKFNINKNQHLNSYSSFHNVQSLQPIGQKNGQNLFLPVNSLHIMNQIQNNQNQGILVRQRQNNGVLMQQNKPRPISSYQSQMVNNNSENQRQNYNSSNGSDDLNHHLQNNENLNRAINRQKSFLQKQMKRSLELNGNQNVYRHGQDQIFGHRINFKEAIVFIHHCRLVFKFLCLYKDTCYFQESIYIKVFKYLMWLLTNLSKINERNGVVAQGQKSSLKLRKLKEVTLEYLTKYKKQIQQNNYHIQPQVFGAKILGQVALTIRQVYNRLNQDINLMAIKSYLSANQEIFVVLGHLCIIIMASLKQIQRGNAEKNYKQLTQFKHIQTILNTPKEQFTVSSFKAYRQKFIS